jgi:HEPN domain-containing protein
MRSKFTREMFHPGLPDAAWNAFTVGDYDAAVFAASKSVQVAVRMKGGFTTTVLVRRL